MNAFSRIKSSQAYAEFESNIRLQWMLVAIIIILAASFAKYLADGLNAERNEVKQQINLLARLQNAATLPLDEVKLTETNQNLQIALKNIPTVSSSSTAEAKALTDIEKMVGSLIKRKRINLLGSEQLQIGQVPFWSVRVDIAGQLNTTDFIEFLSYFDQDAKSRRIASLQYSPKTSNSLNLVVDMLYQRDRNE
ncbi:hypothetical protein [Neptunicella sp. SCSIO 80796]|uniref:hypothetical protein n=1 Tax=Neptunicella plasticusilytica TaxID=3117012 RepID=UPI003A4D89E8